MENWKTVFSTDKLYQAEMIKEILSESNIESVILNHKDSSFKFGEIEVMVSPENHKNAEDIIKTIKL